VRRPQCPACGDPRPNGVSGDAVRPVALESRPRPAAAHGRERVVSANETYQRYKHHVSPVSGVVANLWAREKDELRTGTYNYVAGHYYPVTTTDLSGLRINLIARSGERGVRSRRPARVPSASDRALFGNRLGEEPRRRATLKALGSEAVPSKRLRYSANGSTPARGLRPAKRAA